MRVKKIEEFRCAICNKSFHTFEWEGFPVCIPCHNKIIVEEYAILAEIICSEIREYMSRFIDTDEKVVDMLCDIVSEKLVKAYPFDLIKEKRDAKNRDG